MLRSVRASRSERTCPLPGDDLLAAPLGSLTHAITIQRRPRDVWPWLAQMGKDSPCCGWSPGAISSSDGSRQAAARSA